MTQYNVGSDHSGNGDEECINKICDILEQNGHTTERLGVTPNLEGSLTSRSGVGVFIVNGLCIGTVRSCSENQKNCDKIIFAIPKVIYGGSIKIPDELKTKPLKLDPRQGWPQSYTDINGKTWDEVCGMYDNIEYVWGETCEDCANNILNGTQGGSSTNTTSENEGSIMSGWESITDLLKPLDGEAMVVVRGDAVIIKRIYPPESTRLWIYEGINIVADSVKVSDYSPEIYNTFVVKWGASFENSFEMCFEKHKELFGERKTEVNAIYEVAPNNSTESTSESDESSEQSTGENQDDGGLFGFLGKFLGGEEENSTTNQTSQLQDQSSSTETGDGEQPLEEIPITDEAEAYLFGLREVGKARRKDGHKVECKVIGSKHFEVGEWCRVHIPSFNEDTIMFISKVSHDSGSDNEWITSLTLVDYPPSLGSGQSNSPSSESTESDGTPSLNNDSSTSTDTNGENQNGDQTNGGNTGGNSSNSSNSGGNG